MLSWFSQFVLGKRWAVLNQPIRAEQGFSLSTSFTVDVATTYEVEIQYGKVDNPQPLNLDPDVSHNYATAFSVSVDQTPLVGLRSRMNGQVYYSQGKSSCFIGSFKGAPHHAYRFDLRVNRDLPELTAMNPNVRIRAYTAYISDIHNASTQSKVFGLGLSLLGAICFLPHLLSLRRRDTDNNHHTGSAAS